MKKDSCKEKRAEGVFIRGENINLIALTEDHALNSPWYDWFNDEETTAFMQKHYFPNTREAQLEFFRKNINNSKDKLQLGIQDVSGGPLLGVVSLQGIDHINRRAEISMITGDPAYRKTKYTLEVMRLVVNHAFNTLNLRRIYGGTLIEEWAELLCRTMNFKHEGIFRKDVFKNGVYHDVYFVGLLRDEWEGAGKTDE